MRLGLVGCGIWGRNILRGLLSLRCDVVVVEPAPRERAAASELGAQQVVATLDELPSVDGLVLATPAATHAEVLHRLLPHQVPIFVEKPFTTDEQSAEALVALAGDRLFLMHVWKYHPAIQELARIAHEQELGPVLGLRTFRTNWTSPRRDVDSIWNAAPHDITLALTILGQLPELKFAQAEMLGDACVGVLALYGTQPWFRFEVSNRWPDKRRDVRLHCAEGVAVMRDPDVPWIEITHNSTAIEPVCERRPVSGERALDRELAEFVGYLASGPPPRCSAEEGLTVVRQIARLRRFVGLEH